MIIDGIWITPPMLPDLCEQLDVHRTTVTRWMKKERLPKAVHDLLDITENGKLSYVHPKWEGWVIDKHDGRLLSVDRDYDRRYGIFPGEAASIMLRHEHIAELKKRIRELEDERSSQDRQITHLQERLDKLTSYLESVTEPNIVAWRKRHLGK